MSWFNGVKRKEYKKIDEWIIYVNDAMEWVERKAENSKINEIFNFEVDNAREQLNNFTLFILAGQMNVIDREKFQRFEGNVAKLFTENQSFSEEVAQIVAKIAELKTLL